MLCFRNVLSSSFFVIVFEVLFHACYCFFSCCERFGPKRGRPEAFEYLYFCEYLNF